MRAFSLSNAHKHVHVHEYVYYRYTYVYIYRYVRVRYAHTLHVGTGVCALLPFYMRLVRFRMSTCVDIPGPSNVASLWAV